MDAEHEAHVCSKTKVLLVTFAQVSAYVPPPAARRWHPQRDSWAAYARREYSSVSRDRCPKSSPRVRRQVHQANKLALATPAAFVRCWNFFLIFSLSRQNPAQTLTCINMRRVSSSSESTLSTTRNSSQVTLQERHLHLLVRKYTQTENHKRRRRPTMLLRHIVFAAFAGLALAREEGRPCGLKIAPCPEDYYCRPDSPSCTDLDRCRGTCVRRNKYPSCGGRTVTPRPCAPGTHCIDDPREPGGCGMACDKPGICVPDKPVSCGGFAGFLCPAGLSCYDIPKDGCDPKKGGADCLGMCL